MYDNKQLLMHLKKKEKIIKNKKKNFNLLVKGTTGGICVNDCSIKKMSKKIEFIFNFMIIDKSILSVD